MKNLIIILLSTLWTASFAQIVQPAELVEQSKLAGESFVAFELLQPTMVAKSMQIEIELSSEYQLYNIKQENLEKLLREKPSVFSLVIPTSAKKNLEVELVKVNIFSEDFRVVEAATGADIAVENGHFYRGVIKGQEGSIAAVSIFQNEVRALLSWGEKTMVLGKLKGRKMDGHHILYDSQTVPQKNKNIRCGMPDDGAPYTKRELEVGNSKALGACVGLFFEVDYNVYQSFGYNSLATFNYVSGLFNEVATIFAFEHISTNFSGIIIWNSPSPYGGIGLGALILEEFQETRTSFAGDLGQLISLDGNRGQAAGFNGLCNNNRAESLCFSPVQLSISSVPTYSWDVYQVTHEFGHLFGSRHTHACVWNGNNTAIDGCAGFTEEGCPLPGLPSGGGTIMSYCSGTSVGINLNRRFGPQPGNVIRNRVANAQCLERCEQPACPVNLILTESNFGTIRGDGVMQASRSVWANNTIAGSADITYRAGDFIYLGVGFRALAGSEFEARIEECNSSLSLVRNDESVPAAKPFSTAEVKDRVGDFSEEANLSAYPNPSAGITTLKYGLPSPGPVQLSIHDLNGRILRHLARENQHEAGIHQLEFDARIFPPGLYFCQLLTNQGTKTIKLIIE